MTSLNGDIFVMRNGRSTSQVSIYNYPEHLNPFYEDEQHKRLRFWHLNKSSGSGSRRNSFSLGGLKDVWAFKSFRLKKKSSTLGINKTSESPPPLRRDQQQYYNENGNDLSLPDYRTRYSTPVGSESFQRNAAYRSSLQNVASAKDNASKNLDFNRNNQYRSTIQVMGTKSSNNHNNNGNLRTIPVPQPRRYVYGGSVTPQPHRNSDIGAGVGLSHGSSQISMASTNPFDTDDDYEENNEDVSLAGDRQLITSTPIRKQMQRKKRRAPAPPGAHNASTSANSLSECSLDGSEQPQPLPELRIDECMDIANLTAAIESFVKTTNDESTESMPRAATNQQEATNELATQGATVKQNGDAKPVPATPPSTPSQITETNEVLVEKIQATEKSNETETKSVVEANNTKINDVAVAKTVNQPEVGHVECIHVHMENARSATTTPTPTERTEPSQFTSFRGSQTRSSEPQVITTKTSFTLTTPPTTRRASTKKARASLPNTDELKFPETEELKITENVTVAKANKSHETTKPIVPTKPHLAEIHKPARGITSTSAAAGAAAAAARDKDTAREKRQAPLSPVPPVRHSTSAKLRQALKAQTNEMELKLKSEAVKAEDKDVRAESATTNTTQTLTITESHEDLLERDNTMTRAVNDKEITNATATTTTTTTTTITTHRTQSPTELREEALESLYRPKPSTSYMEWKQSSLAPLEKSVPPEKRKSVKDIIESINRSQRLLNASAHKDQAHNGSSLSIGVASVGSDTPIMRRKFSSPSMIERNLDDMQRKEVNGNATTESATHDGDLLPSTSTAATNENLNTNGDGNEPAQDPQKLNNNEIFKKCIVKKEVQYDYREQSPTTSNLDWNPVPKPKRNKNLLEQ